MTKLPESVEEALKAWQQGEVYLSLYREFDRFDSKNTPVLIAPLSAYARQAREILKDRTRKEIEYAAMIAEWVVEAPLEKLLEVDDPELKPLITEMIGESDETLPRLLQRRQRIAILHGVKDLRKARWQEIFAALALVYVARAISTGDSASMEAAEAIQIALSLAQRSDSASKRGAYWRKKAISYAKGKEDMSANEIATGFLDYYTEKIEESRERTFTHRTVADWIRKDRSDF